MYINLLFFVSSTCFGLRSQLPRGLRRRSAAVRLLRSWVRIPPGAWMFVCCECCVLSGRGLCDELITRPEESYQLWCVVVCDLETSTMRRPWPALGRSATAKKKDMFRAMLHTPHKPHNSLSTHPRHQPAATRVNTTRYCKYSQVLLMMGENIARNMYSWQRIIN